MFCFSLKSVILPLLILIFGCPRVLMMSLHLLYIFGDLIGNQKHVILSLFKVIKTIRHALGKKLD